MFWLTTCDLAYKNKRALVTDRRPLSWPSRPRHATCFTYSFMDCGNRSEVDSTPGRYQPALWCTHVWSNIEHDCVIVCAFKHPGLKKDLCTELRVFIITIWWKSHFQAAPVRTATPSHVLMTNDLTLWLGNDTNVHPWAFLFNVCDAYGEK